MLRDGPIPVFIHGVIEYIAGVLFIAAPLLFGYDSGTATGVSVAVGVVILVVAATTAGPTGLIPRITASVHVTLDFVLAAFLIASPFLFGFSDETAPTAFFVALGIAHLLITIGTRFKSSEPEPGAPPEAERPA
ncbi:hypothetical protein BH24ACT23_BH24ACT23_10660 [soil metagenome]